MKDEREKAQKSLHGLFYRFAKKHGIYPSSMSGLTWYELGKIFKEFHLSNFKQFDYIIKQDIPIEYRDEFKIKLERWEKKYSNVIMLEMV